MPDKDYVREDNLTEYPKWIDHPTDKAGKTVDGKDISKRVLVKTPEEEEQLLGKAKVDPKKANKENPQGWSDK